MKNIKLAFVVFVSLFIFVIMVGDNAVFANEKPGFHSSGRKNDSGGFSGPGPEVMSAKRAATMRDDSRVFLRGHIIQKLAEDKYLFRDSSGTIIMDIDDGDWNGQTVSPEDIVEVYGKVDKDRDSVEIEVKRLQKK